LAKPQKAMQSGTDEIAEAVFRKFEGLALWMCEKKG
jgi:hypothetical protein